MNKLIIATTAFVLFIVFVLPAIFVLPIKLVPYNDQPGYTTDLKRELHGDIIVEQEFISQEDRLAAIGMTIGNPNLKNKKQVVLNLYENKNIIRTSALSGLNIPDGNFIRFIFPEITDSKGKSYKFTLESQDTPREEVLYVYFSQSTPNWFGETTYFNEPFEDGKLAFVAYHKPISKLSLVVDFYKNWMRKIW